MIRLDHVSRSFGPVHAVRDVSFDVPAGQVAGILGPNGAGKTTTIRMITGALPPTAGRVTVAGHDTIDASIDARRHLGYLPEGAPLYPEMPVQRYLRYRAALFGLRGPRRAAAAGSAIERCWLGEVRTRPIGHLSKGFRQRVGLAAALLHDPPALVLDEPTSGLDPAQIAETRRLIRDLAGDHTMLIVSHLLPEVERTCDRIIVLARGAIRADGTPHDLLAATAWRLEARPAGEPERFRSALADLPGITAVTVRADDDPDGFLDLRLDAADGRDHGRDIGAACLAARATIRRLQPDAPSLEELYIRLVSETPEEDA